LISAVFRRFLVRTAQAGHHWPDFVEIVLLRVGRWISLLAMLSISLSFLLLSVSVWEGVEFWSVNGEGNWASNIVSDVASTNIIVL
jgi:hypothetical protein